MHCAEKKLLPINNLSDINKSPANRYILPAGLIFIYNVCLSKKSVCTTLSFFHLFVLELFPLKPNHLFKIKALWVVAVGFVFILPASRAFVYTQPCFFADAALYTRPLLMMEIRRSTHVGCKLCVQVIYKLDMAVETFLICKDCPARTNNHCFCA